MNEIEYRKYWEYECKREREAKGLYRAIRDLYGEEIKKDKMFIRARLDKVITQEEQRLLIEFYR